MNKLYTVANNIKLAFTKSGLGYVFSRVPSMIFWSVVSTGLLVSCQYLFFTFVPSSYFLTYNSPAHVNNTDLGQRPTLSYCRISRGDYPIVVNAQLRKVEPPVYVKQYQVDTLLPKGSGCIDREVANTPTSPGDYKIFYTVVASLPFGVEKTASFETAAFNVGIPKNLYDDYTLTVNEVDASKDGKAVYDRGQNLQYAFTANALVEYFGTTERHLVCGGKDIFIDSYSGRSTAGQKDSVNNTINIPSDLIGTCRLELRITATVGDTKAVVTQTLTSNSFVVE